MTNGVRTLTAASPSELGYSVAVADSAATALLLPEKHDEIALVFTDIVMPEVNGRRLAEMAEARRPFTLDQLAHKVRSVIDGQGPRR